MKLIKTLTRYALYTLLVAVFVSCKEHSLKVGQTWIWASNKDNPFKSSEVYEQKIIGIKDGYVWYIQNKKDTLSMSKRMFVVGAELQENCN
jgi:hypothetical protein|tara:strand:+ start:1866 stop:2138 length:273 start_codon:yes stop_codon:yes gene_type:complete